MKNFIIVIIIIIIIIIQFIITFINLFINYLAYFHCKMFWNHFNLFEEGNPFPNLHLHHRFVKNHQYYIFTNLLINKIYIKNKFFPKKIKLNKILVIFIYLVCFHYSYYFTTNFILRTLKVTDYYSKIFKILKSKYLHSFATKTSSGFHCY